MSLSGGSLLVGFVDIKKNIQYCQTCKCPCSPGSSTTSQTTQKSLWLRQFHQAISRTNIRCFSSFPCVAGGLLLRKGSPFRFHLRLCTRWLPTVCYRRVCIKRPTWFCLGSLSSCLVSHPHITAQLRCGGRWHVQCVLLLHLVAGDSRTTFYKTRRRFSPSLRKTNKSGEAKQKCNPNDWRA